MASQQADPPYPMSATDPYVLAAYGADDAAEIEDAIFKLLAKCQLGASICPSAAARAVYGDEARWREAMPRVRAVAVQLVHAGRLEITQGGLPVDGSTASGAIRLRLPKR
jgi:hypothetical protein